MRILSSIAAAGTLALASPAHADAFAPGEQTVLDVDYSGIKAGTAVITVGAPTKQGLTDVWPIVTLADTASLFALYPLHDKFVSWWDFNAGHSMGWDFTANENRKGRKERCRLNTPESGKAQVQRSSDDTGSTSGVLDTPPDSQDIAAAFFTMRRMKLEPGSDVKVPVFTGRHSWDLTAHVGTVEPVEVKAGKFDALPLDVEVHFEGKLESKRSLKVWVSNDEHHALLKLSAELALGSLNAEAVAYHPGASLDVATP
ncbi:MAG: DUF3108 domain-containing protein [Deltaproteobacteria bacterium]|nr:DUF3108 domain-containing protein [Deltaproteobacteria bacterium]